MERVFRAPGVADSDGGTKEEEDRQAIPLL
jgi:hypothetical protein